MICNTLTGESYQFTEHKAKGFKMYGMASLNTSTLNNSFCQAMGKNKDLICASCYAKTLESYRKLASKRYTLNGLALSKRKFKDKEIPIVNYRYLRFNGFGELINKIHYHNLVAIAEANPQTACALWSKRLSLLSNITKLDNLFYIYSSPKRNTVVAKPKDFHKTFTVYNISYVREHNIKINCAKKCLECLKCYTQNDITHIAELIR